MKIGQNFNQLTPGEYLHYIDNHKKYTDFNTLGLYRSLLENEKLTLEDKIKIRDHAHQVFKKTFDFLQLKDPYTYVQVTILGQTLTAGDERQLWKDVIANQEKILKEKRINHRSFGKYSKHSCGYEECPYNGVMFRQDSYLLSSGGMHFHSDKDKLLAKKKSDTRKKERKTKKQIIDRSAESE